jgi:hypothetical protein
MVWPQWRGALEPAEAARVLAGAAQLHLKALEREPDYQYEGLLSTLIHPLNSPDGVHAARLFARRIVANPDHLYFTDGEGPLVFHPDVLERFLSNGARTHVRQRAGALVAAVGISAWGPAPSLPFLPAAGAPLPCRLSTQDLVELLKMPTCVGEVRRVILDQLGNRYGRRFATHWDFVRYAREQKLDLDFTTPPQRPDAKLPPLIEL